MNALDMLNAMRERDDERIRETAREVCEKINENIDENLMAETDLKN